MARSRKRPKTSSVLSAVFEEHANPGGALLHTRRFGREQCLRYRGTRWSHDSIANEATQSAVVVGMKPIDGFKARDRTSSVDDQDGRAALYAVNQRAKVVLGVSNTGLLHNS